VLDFKDTVLEKQIHYGMWLEKAKKLLLPADTDQRHLVPLNGHSPEIQQEASQLSTLQLNQMFSNAIHFTSNL